MGTERLSSAELEVWYAWKQSADQIRRRVVRDVAAVTGLSDPDYGVLSRLADLGGGQLRQQDLADSMGWDKSRLSHYLTRMQQRGLVERQPSDGAVTVRLTPAGRVVLDQAVPVHAAAVRRHLLSRLTAEQQGAIVGLARGE
ncbi:MAG: MarR family winged helix-turn-helix transcriptional regulator [Streptosporangiaceae bacterium]